jgi:hypothetical protein
MKVRIESDRGVLRLRWVINGKRCGFSLEVPDQPVYRAMAKQKAGIIEQDWHLGIYDETLAKYNLRATGNAAVSLSCPELFRQFTGGKVLSEGSLTKYRGLLNHLLRCLDKPAVDVTSEDALNFRAALLERVSERTAREYLWLVRTAFDWGEGKFSLPPKNPFSGIGKTIKPPPRERVAPFSEGEIRLILEGFKRDRHYNQKPPVLPEVRKAAPKGRCLTSKQIHLFKFLIFLLLLTDICPNHSLVSSHCSHKVSPCPKLMPCCTPPVTKLPRNMNRTFAFEIPDNLGD